MGECLAAAGGCAAITGTRGDEVAAAAVGNPRTHGVAGASVAGDVADRARVLDTVDTALQADRTGANADIGPLRRST